MAYAHKDLETGKEIMDFIAIHKSASQHARQVYLETFKIDYHDDPEYKTGGPRHKVWLNAFEARQQSLILDPYQD